MKSEVKYLKGIVKKYTGVNVESNTRKREVVHARRMYYKIMRELYKKTSLKSIGETLPLKQNHATVLHQINEFDIDYKQDRSFRKKFDNIRNSFYGLVGEPEVDLEEENIRLRIEIAELKKEVEYLRPRAIQPRNQQTKVYHCSEGISGSIY